MKIAYIIGTIAAQGGTTRMVSEKANLFASDFGYDITIITMIQHQNEPNTIKLHERVKQVNLDIPYYSQYTYKYPKRLWVKRSINKLMKKRLPK